MIPHNKTVHRFSHVSNRWKRKKLLHFIFIYCKTSSQYNFSFYFLSICPKLQQFAKKSEKHCGEKPTKRTMLCSAVASIFSGVKWISVNYCGPKPCVVRKSCWTGGWEGRRECSRGWTERRIGIAFQREAHVRSVEDWKRFSFLSNWWTSHIMGAEAFTCVSRCAAKTRQNEISWISETCSSTKSKKVSP